MKIFVGLVTHPESRFNGAGEAMAELNFVAGALGSAGHEVVSLVSDRDDYDSNQYPLNVSRRLTSAWKQAELETRWRRYVASGGRQSTPSTWDVERVLASARRCLSAVGIPKAGRDLSEAGLRRLINIDLSHLRLWSAAIHEEADVVLVMEDDARFDSSLNTAQFVEMLTTFPREGLGFAVLSKSLSAQKLGLASHATVAGRVNAEHQYWVEMSPAVTNTVCANAYSLAMARKLVDEIDSSGLFPVHPIDWRLNQFLMNTSGVRCFWAEPAPFVQASMHGSGDQ
jgi:hypothetical protein